MAATFSIFLHRGRALVAQQCPFDPLSFSLSPSLSFSTPSPAPLSLSLPRVYQVIGCEMKSNENPFRRVHSRSAVGRVAQPPLPLAPPFRPPTVLDTAHLRFSSCSPSATSSDRHPCVYHDRSQVSVPRQRVQRGGGEGRI